MPGSDIPVIDIAPLAGRNRAAAKSTGEALCHAFETVGFAYVSGHGISDSIVDAAFMQSEAFFSSPLDDKRSQAINDAHRGYIPLRETQLVDSGLGRSALPNLSESFFVLYDADPDGVGPLHDGFLAGPNQWPPWLPDFESAVRAYMAATEIVCRRLLSGFALGLGLPAEGFNRQFTTATTYLRMLHYPPHPEDADADQFGQGPHTDFGAVTLLAQDSAGGLEVRRRDGTWIDAQPLPGTFVVNVGDLFPVWTGGRFVSTPHRVINRSGRNRLSIAYFFDPSLDSVVECLPTCRPPRDSALPDSLNYGEHTERRLTRNYAFRSKTDPEPDLESDTDHFSKP